jgi:Putative DNA-binding domain
MADAASFQEAFGLALINRSDVTDAALARALRIHRNTSAKAAQDALADNYPVVRALVGDHAFEGVATDFVDAHPPVDPRLCLYGEAFDQFLGSYAPFAELPYLADVASVERMVITALFAADAQVLDGSKIVLDLDHALTLHPAVCFSRFASPAASLWQAHQPDAPDDGLDQINWRFETVLVTRPANAVMVTLVEPETAIFLSACAEGDPLGVAAAKCGPKLTDIFALLISAGCFTSPHSNMRILS